MFETGVKVLKVEVHGPLPQFNRGWGHHQIET